MYDFLVFWFHLVLSLHLLLLLIFTANSYLDFTYILIYLLNAHHIPDTGFDLLPP